SALGLQCGMFAVRLGPPGASNLGRDDRRRGGLALGLCLAPRGRRTRRPTHCHRAIVRRMISPHAIIEGGRLMSLTIRRVVTGHDRNGRAIVSIDESVKNAAQTRPGAEAAVIWTSEGFPVDNDGSADTSTRKVGTTLENGTVFRVVSFGPGVSPRNHRTD